MSPRQLLMRVLRWWHGPYCSRCGDPLNEIAAFGRTCYTCAFVEVQCMRAEIAAVEASLRTPRRLIPATPDADGAR